MSWNPPTYKLVFPDRQMILSRAHIMGVVNVTPDSFSDGGMFYEQDTAIRQALRLAEEGADIIDVGGESTRPGSSSVPADEEWRRVEPVIRALESETDVPISIDTMKPGVAWKAIEAGAIMVNDVSGLRDKEMIELVAREHVAVTIMHMLGEPKTMQETPVYRDVVKDVKDYLRGQMQVAMDAGVAKDSIVIDPGIGFGKTVEHNLELINHIPDLAELGRPVIIGASRKSFIGAITRAEVTDRLEGSLAAAVMAVVRGARILRVHDVKQTLRALKVAEAILRA
jgi:dihydropteroate synthase